MHALDLESQDFKNDPWPTYRWFREHDPIHWSPRYRSFFLFRYDHIRQSLEARDCLVSHPFRATRQALGASLLDIDGEDHRRLRDVLSPRFKAHRVRAFAASELEATVDGSLQALEREGTIDLIEDLALELPVRVILRLLGAPQSDCAKLRSVLRPIVSYIDDPRSSLEAADRARETLEDYARGLLTTTTPESESTSGDLVAALRAGRLDEDEAARLIVMLIAAATETTAASLGNVLAILLTRAELVQRVARDAEFASAVIAETIRWDPPLHSTLRVAGQKFVLADTTIPEGAPVQLMLASGNRDPLVYERADDWDPSRRFARPPLSFGAGSHHCMGFALANAELALVIQRFCQRFPHSALLREVQVSGRTFRRPVELPVVLNVDSNVADKR